MIITCSIAGPGEAMAEELLDDAVAGAVARHPWWRARASLCIRLLERMGVRPGARVLDAGCGWGVTLEALEGRGYQAAGLDASPTALARLDRSDRLLIQADLGTPLPAIGETFDAVLALDVIEHIDDDRCALTNVARLARPDGVAIVSVPALPALYSEYDDIQGHRRRYLPDTLRGAFEGSGLSVERVVWWGATMVAPLKFWRRRLRTPGEPAIHAYRRYLALPPEPVRTTLRMVLALESAMTLRGLTPVGTSLFALSRLGTPREA